jgi:hypothetical protein
LRLTPALANLQPGERVHDLGTGAGDVLATAKTAVQGGLCVDIDAVQGFLDVDVPTRLARSRLTVAPAGKDTEKGYLVKGSVADGALLNLIAACTMPANLHDIELVFKLQATATALVHSNDQQRDQIRADPAEMLKIAEHQQLVVLVELRL